MSVYPGTHGCSTASAARRNGLGPVPPVDLSPVKASWFSRSALCLGLVLIASATVGQPGRAQGPQGAPGSAIRQGRALWWQDDAIKKEIGLREDQVKRIDALYAKRARDLEPLNTEFAKQRAELNRLMSDRSVGTAAIELQVARMEVPRVKINESYFAMLYRMYLVLDPDQNKKLQAVFDRQRDRGRDATGGR